MTARHEELKVFQLADRLALDVFRMSGGLPAGERDGLQAHLRRAAIAVPVGIIEGCARRDVAEREHMVGAALGAASEMRYLLSVLNRLELIDDRDFDQLSGDYDLLVRGLQKFVSAVRNHDGAPRGRGDERDDEGARRRPGYGDDQRRGAPGQRRGGSDWRDRRQRDRD